VAARDVDHDTVGKFSASLMIVFRSEPSGFEVRTRPAARSKKYKRPTVFAADFTDSDLEALEDGMNLLFLSCYFHLSSVVSTEVFSVG